MKHTLIVLIFIFECSINVFSSESILTCTFSDFSTFNMNSKNEINVKALRDKNPTKIIFANLNQTTPLVKEESREVLLKVVHRSDDSIFMIEMLAPTSMYTIYPKLKVVVWSKQYLDPGGRPFSFMSMGTCK